MIGGEGGLRGSSSLPTSVPLSHLLDRVQLLKLKDREMLKKEYESIDSGKQFTWSASNEEVNRCKNRYANVVAYDHSRVILPATSVPGSDYINANFIDCRFNNGGSLYIATQGPLLDTIGDFWRMIWEERVSTVAMVTKLEERSRVKCDQYWPDIGSQLYGVMQVTLKDVLELSSYIIRTFTLSKMNCSESRELFQLQFTSWPDYGVPSHPTLLLQYIRRVKSANELSPGPIVVHCSAGVGRTGVLIAIDTCMDRIMRGSETVDIFNVVTSLRSQRNYMVQSDDQYQFIYEAILEGVTSPANTEVTADNLNQYVRDLLAAGEAGAQRLRDEFQRLSVVRYEAQQFQYANMPFNKMKNRSSAILPLDSTRVNIQPIRGVEGSDYINANYIDGYRHKRCYIATQSPLATTVDDFWRMVWDTDCSIIVMVTNLVEAGRERCVQYWPVERSMRYQYFVLDPSSTINFGHYIVREFRMTDARDGQSRIIYQFQFLNWPQDDCHLSKYISSTSLTSSLTHLTNATLGQQFINFIGQVETTRSKLVDPTRPMVIHCELGSARTGAFISLSYILERMRTEGVVDVFETVKILRTQRMSMVTTEDIYSFCYRSSAQFLGSFDHYVK
ncbi:hypothetical protein HELRODRAFT_112884 [Helobdella robusta]|uniref:Protein-tyrosine-phosphatase n=1 Tax=Helobdella robusta TaxID=6412 RepID=T1EFM9_HELRO|nr:hypothetical protein HELRODRAFT_112884 [Helobdella robusta]ESO01101.1 hypothetical protein HELRODRAFT_112884 [Helobdella robusta]